MPRRSPSAVRAARPFHPRRSRSFSIIDGVSAATSAEIRRWEQTHGRPGEVARDLAWWKIEAAEMTRRGWYGANVGTYEFGDRNCPCCDYDQPRGRWGLEDVLQALSRRGRRELGAVVRAIDARVLARTYGEPPDSPGWWARRM